MSHPDWQRVKEIFHAVHPESGVERDRRLDELCAGDDALRSRVLALLAADEDGRSFLGSRELEDQGLAAIAGAKLGAEEAMEGPGDRIGPYKLLQEIGEGGFGVVYMAEQEKPIRRRVALKVIKPGMDTKQVIARFEAERQALAMMDHPNIAKVFEAGTTPSGRPFFVMELVKGIPITDYCDDNKLDTQERLELFVDVCRAVQHAHQAGIIHRDLKPSNVLVTLHDGTPVPKVIDFGVAKATQARLTESTLFTEFHQFIGTPTYMSPEQAAYEGLDVDPRSDVYSLGVLLYELLTGTTPHDSSAMKRAAYFEVLRILKEEEPPKPSTRVSTMGGGSDVHAMHRRADPSGLARMLRGDLDWIVMKALEKDRRRRYDSATEMAADITRYFEQRPIEARPPSRLYKAQKLFRRKRGRFAAAAVILLALLVDIGYVTWQRNHMATVTTPSPGPVGARSDLILTSDEHPCSYASARPSPDGTRMLTLDYCEGGVYLHDLKAGSVERLTGSEFYWGAEWSPDARKVVVGSGSTASPRVLDLASGHAELPAALEGVSLGEIRWSPDGEHLTGAMTRENGNLATVLLSLVSGERTVLAEGVREGQGTGAFSPDGRYVVFSDLVGVRENLFVLEVATGERWPLTDGPENDGDPLWSPDGRTVLYGNRNGMWALPVRAGRADGTARLVRRDRVRPNAWTEHGYYYTATNTIARAHRIGVDPATGRATGQSAAVALPAGDLPNVRFAWSPDMKRTAVAGWGDNTLHLMDDERVVSFPIGLEILPSKLWWSADGTEVLFTSTDRAQRDRSTRTVHALDIERGTLRQLFDPLEAIGHIHVSPDASRMVFFRSRGSGMERHRSRRMFVSDLGESESLLLAGANEHGELSTLYGQPTFSPDGSRVLFLRNPMEPGEFRVVPFSLWVVDVDGSNERLLTESSGMIRPPVWDPTGRMVAYLAQDAEEERLRLMVVSVEDGSTHEIEAFRELGDATLQTWSPDGAWLGVSETVGRWEVWVDRDVLGDSNR